MRKGEGQAGVHVLEQPTEAMIEAGVAFLREAMGDLYPARLIDEREVVAELFKAMVAQAAACPETC